jgi:hypothetical protein
MHDQVGAERERSGQDRRRGGAINGEPPADGVGYLGRAGDVGDRPQWVGRRLDPHQPGRPGAAAARSRSSDIVSMKSTATAPFAANSPSQRRNAQYITRGATMCAPGSRL